MKTDTIRHKLVNKLMKRHVRSGFKENDGFGVDLSLDKIRDSVCIYSGSRVGAEIYERFMRSFISCLVDDIGDGLIGPDEDDEEDDD